MKTTTSKSLNRIALPGILLIAGLSGNATAASKSWSMSGGDSSKAAYSIGSTVAASASSTVASAQGSAFADVAVLNSGWKRFAYANAYIKGTKTSLEANGRVDILGGTIWSATKYGSLNSFSATLPYLSKSWSPPISPVFVVGGIPVTVKPSVSVGISANVNGNVNTSTLAFNGSFAPASFDCSAGVSASVVSGLVRANGNLTLCRVSPSVTSNCSWKYRSANSSANLAYGTLGGSIDLEAGPSWFSYKLNLMSWTGYSANQSLFNESVRF